MIFLSDKDTTIKEPDMPTAPIAATYGAALQQPHSTLRGHDGFTYVQYSPSVGLTARPKVITVLFCDGVEVDRGSLSEFKSLLKFERPVVAYRTYAASKRAAL